MKMNFKVLTISALMFAATSCSKDETNNNAKTNGEQTTALITLSQTGEGVKTRAAVAGATNDEKAIKNITLFIFNAGESLEAITTMTAAEATTGKEIKTSSGAHYFLAAINTPSTVAANATSLASIALGDHISVVNAKIMEAASVADLTATIATGDGFFMTNKEAPTVVNIVAGGTVGNVPAANKISIKVGRATAKVNVEFPASVDQTAANGALSSVEYLVAGNPKKMYLFPVMSVAQLQTPFFSAASVVTADYSPDLTAVAAGDFKTADGAPANAAYAVENANATPKQGNSSLVVVKGIFTPTVWYDNTNTIDATPANAGDDFYRIGIENASGVVDSYTANIYSTTLSQADLNTITSNNANAVIVKYTGGVCYYPLYLADDAQGANLVAKRTVKRNSYFYVTINKVNGPGANTPDGVITDPDKPLETETYIEATIDILDWDVINQNGTI